jgi:hypothetical protein
MVQPKAGSLTSLILRMDYFVIFLTSILDFYYRIWKANASQKLGTVSRD